MRKEKVKKYTVIGAITIVLGILSFMMYQSYAYYKVNYTGNIVNTTVGAFGSYEYAYTGSVQEFVIPVSGYYDVELWGASGRTFGEYQKGFGGYTKGTIYLEKDETIYVYVGEQGKQGNYGTGVTNYGAGAVETFNGGGAGGRGGGNATYPAPNYSGGSSGGGATDVRLVNGTWNNSASLRSRIMVAGGAGAPDLYYAVAGNPPANLETYTGNGGGLLGINGTAPNGTVSAPPSIVYETRSGRGGSQTIGGSGYISGTFGIGGTGSPTGADICYGHNGGGGGYYGGGGGNHTLYWCYVIGGGGGSSYISGYAGVNSVQESGGTAAQPLHTNNTIHYSGKYFIKGNMEVGGNLGNGKAKVTYAGSSIPERTNTKLDNIRYIKSCFSGNSLSAGQHWAEIQAIKDGINVAYEKTVTATIESYPGLPYTRITDGDITADNHASANNTVAETNCITIDLIEEYDLDEITLWSYWGDGRRYNDNVLSVGATNIAGITSLSTIIHNYLGTTGYNETQLGKRYTAWD